jgi:FKBP-type peptidyl-prolyl cis-trans isomerase 2
MRPIVWMILVISVSVSASFLILAHAEMNAPVADGATVLIEFTITVPESRIVIPKNVSQYVPGRNQMLPNLEKALTGMKTGQEKRVDLSVNEAFGPYDETKKTVMRKDTLPSNVTPGMVLTTEEGVPFVVVSTAGPDVEVDFNHPLAGKHVVIDVKILKVEPPTTGRVQEHLQYTEIDRASVS